MDTRTSTVRQHVADLQAQLHRHQLDAVLVPSSDPHLSEYLPARWQGRERFSGFTGSMGTLVVLTDRAVVFADSRYWVQAEAELQGTGVALEKIATGDANAHVGWLARQLPRGATLAVDGSVLALAAAQQLKTMLAAQGVAVRTDLDLLEGAWTGRPALPTAAVYEHRPPHAPTPRAQKLEQVRRAMAQHGATHHFISTVDDIAWLTNLRGADVNYNPVFIAHLLVERERATLFTSEGKIAAAQAQALAADGVAVAPYAQAAAALGELPPGSTLLVDPRRITLAFRQAVPAHVAVVEAINPSTLAKSRKTEAEAAFVREAMERDGAAMCAFYAWFETALGREAISELTIDERLSAQRQAQPGFVSLSFPTIAGFNGNGAMPHYRATPASHAQISTPTGLAAQGLLLIDSGAQYLGGTTDITRVWPIGQTTPAQRRDFTLVLKGMIALSRMRFPRGTLSPMLDAIARAPLWEQRLDYGHGTGHGVGYFLNVHEGPQSISRALAEPHMAMQPGMITSNEPGLYRPGQWGVRIENLLLNVPDQASEFGEFLAFETLTLCPIDTRCLDRSLLREDELAWLNAYHAEVLRRLRPHVSGEARAWLETRSAAL
ncbi:MAG TPA: aminopeptidase P family protein [Burkholderiaceae bacterium]|nr:aminopeptidase P family protein [Burkholderiaceae bacterium]